MANKNTNPGGGKPQFLQTSTMPNPHISPHLTTLGRGNVPVARNLNPKPHKTPKSSHSHYSSLITHIPQYRNQIFTLLGVPPLKFRKELRA